MPEAVTTKRSPANAPERRVIDYISQFMPVTDAEAADIIDSLKIKTFKKGATLLCEGQVSKICYFVMKGCIRQYYLVDGEERTTHFYTEGQPVSSYEGIYRNMPSKYYLSCVEDCIVSAGSPEDEVAFFEKFPRFEPVCRMAVEEELGKSHDLLSTFILSSPEERYLHLMNTRPDLLDRVPQYQLASYLGVTPESLSRIRKRIMQR